LKILQVFQPKLANFPIFGLEIKKTTDYDSVVDEGTIAISAPCQLMDGWTEKHFFILDRSVGKLLAGK
jgi:hypothetical protein